MRSIHGGDRESGALIVGERVRVGQTMRFHVRDADSADDDLRAALRAARGAIGAGARAARSCSAATGGARACSRGPTTTPRAIAEELAAIPAAGLFCNGEIGPVGGRSFLHGFTATMVVFETTP